MGLRIGAVALAALIFISWGEPTVLFVIVLVILLVIVLGLIELIGRPPRSQRPRIRSDRGSAGSLLNRSSAPTWPCEPCV